MTRKRSFAMQSTSPGEIALQHLDRVRSELRSDLDSVEEKISELEAEGVVKRSRIEDLLSLLQALADLDTHFSETGFKEGDHSIVQQDLLNAQDSLKAIIDLIEEEVWEPNQSARLTNAYSEFRARLMNTMNAMDLVKVALRKLVEISLRKTTPSQILQSQIPGAGLRSSMGSSAIIRSQELERQRIAREIHDGPAQAIANVVLRMDILSKIYEKDPTQVPKEISKMKNISQQALDEIRGFIFDLRPMTLQDLGLVATIKRIVSSFKENKGADVRFAVDGKEYPLGQLVNLTVFRIAQEALNNIKKYAECTTAWVHLKYMADKVILIVEDDGIGFNVEEVSRSQKRFETFGMLGMKERADDINAEFDIKSAPGEGTKVVLVIPIENNPAMSAHWDEIKYGLVR